MENLTYVTGNYGKYISVKEKFEKHGMTISYFEYDLEEPSINDIEYISKEKAKQAFLLLGTPVFVIDTGFYIKNYPNQPGYPGAFVKRSKVSSNVLELLETMKDVKDRACYFLDCLTFYDGQEFVQFLGSHKGTLSYELKGEKDKKAKSNLWYLFIPLYSSKTIAQMTEEERNYKKEESATEKFLKWYDEKYKKNKCFVKK